MALGVYDYYKEKNLALPIILGINNSQEMNEKIMSGEIYDSVRLAMSGVDEKLNAFKESFSADLAKYDE